VVTSSFDWRKQYVLCEHVALNWKPDMPKSAVVKRKTRACCWTCEAEGFLRSPNLRIFDTHPSGYTVGKIKEIK
jgi:hypothetical protein